MATVHCKACGKSYSYEENGCCPSCGAYNRPPRRETVEADGTVHHLDDRAAPTGRMPGGGGKVCFEEKTCYEEQTRGGRVRARARKAAAENRRPAAVCEAGDGGNHRDCGGGDCQRTAHDHCEQRLGPCAEHAGLLVGRGLGRRRLGRSGLERLGRGEHWPRREPAACLARRCR